jgi:2-polyprenyl-3-methyl-5-hydroxy-6-metoxy-1,4-benzoquinol methylase
VETSETSPVENTEEGLDLPAGATRTAFSAAQYDESYPDGYENHFWNLARTTIVLNALQSNVAKTDVILEIGCGRGLYVSKARQAGFIALGCDLGRPRVHDAVSNYVQVGADFRDLDPATLATVSTVLVLDVLEHLEDPDDFLKQLSVTMPALHTVIATVPARKELWSNYDDHFGHFRRYTKPELETLMRSAGFPEVEARYFFRFLYLPMWILANIQGNRSVAIHSPANPWLHKVLGIVGRLDARILPGGLWGTSVIGIAKKK